MNLREKILKNGLYSRLLLGINNQTKKTLHDMSHMVNSSRDEIVHASMYYLLQDYELARIFRERGLEPGYVRGILENLLDEMFKGDFSEEHTVRIARLTFDLIRIGIPPRMLIMLMFILSQEIVRHSHSNSNQVKAIIQACGWLLSNMMESYFTIDEEVFANSLGITSGSYDRLLKLTAEKIYRNIDKELA